MFKKRTDSMTVREIVEQNTGIPADEFIKRSPEPYIKNLKEAVELLKSWSGETVTVVGDYDSDGINATAIMAIGLRYYGIKANLRLPHRFSEGYGLSEKIIDEIDEGVVITVDNGIAAHDAIKKAKDKGLKVIVTDHHMAPVDENGNKVFPEADIIVDPSTEDESEFHGYCGAAIAYRFIKELCPDRDLNTLLVLASIATVSDVMTLHGPNRDLVVDGLQAINKHKVVPGLDRILYEIKLTEGITEDDYGFKLGPIFNASGRLYDNGSEQVLQVLTMDRENPRLPWRVSKLIKTNEKRKALVAESLEAIPSIDRPSVVYDPTFLEGIIGILAGRICENYECPAIVFTKSDDGLLKGSGRSTPDINLKEVLDKIQSLIVKYGGHAGAAGLSIKEEDLQAFTEAFTEAVGPIPEKDDTVWYDLDLVNIEETMEELKKYAPYGEGNPRPVFKIRYHADSSKFRRIGSDQSHFLIKGKDLTLMGFGLADKYESLGKPELIDCVGNLSESWFAGKKSYNFEVLDFEAAI